MLTRSRSSSLDLPVESDSLSQSQSISKQLSSASSSYFDSQDSAVLDEISLKKSTTRKCKDLSDSSSDSNQRVMMAPDGVFNCGSSSLISLPHPREKLYRRMFLLSADKSSIYELNRCKEEHRSWFIGDSVQTDGSIILCTPVDPLFLVLPLILSFKLDKFTTIETLLDFDTNPQARIISDLVSEDQWLNICDRKVIAGSVHVYRYSSQKTMMWLKEKVKLVSNKLISDGVYVGMGSQTSGFLQSKKGLQMPKEEYLCYASGMIGEYLPTALQRDLLDAHPSSTGTKRTVDDFNDENGIVPKRANIDNTCAEPTEDYSKSFTAANKPKVKAVSKSTQGLKALAKVDKKGMKSLTSFFGKKV